MDPRFSEPYRAKDLSVNVTFRTIKRAWGPYNKDGRYIMLTNVTKIVVGVDVAKKHLDICIYDSNHIEIENKKNVKHKILRVENSIKGLNIMLTELARYNFNDIERIVWESSGGYENLMSKVLEQAGYFTWSVDPKRIRGFVASQGIKVKTDKIDAKMIALFASQNKPDYTKIKRSANHNDLRALVRRKIDLIEMVGMEKKRLNHPKEGFCKEEIDTHIQFMEKQIESIRQKINDLIKDDDNLLRNAEIIDSIPGVGESTVHVILAELPEIGAVTDKQIAAIVGVAPYQNESGTYKGSASIDGGRFFVRNALY